MFKSFRLNILIRIIILTVLVGIMFYFLLVDQHYLRGAYLFAFLIIALVELFWYIDRTNKTFTSFLLGLLQNDFTTTFSEKNKGKTFSELHHAFNLITEKFKQISSEKQAQHIYLETLVEHVKVGIISFDETERIHLMNESLKNLLDKPNILYLKSLETVDASLVDTLRAIEPGKPQLIKVSLRNQLMQLSINASSFKLQDKKYKLISIQNIKNELESNELDAWQKLIRVLTHEIMNSVTPISSLSETLSGMISQEENKANPDPELLPKLEQGLGAIKARSTGLQAFTEAYRKLTRIPAPSFEEVNLVKVMEGIKTLLANDLKAIDFQIKSDMENPVTVADPALLEQVFINLIKNAIEALEEVKSAKLTISIFMKERLTVTIADNGRGIDADKLDKIFIPFFTTKAEGSGIGLALSREILRLHNATISVESEPYMGTTFLIVF